mmetsp:Transcript_684/g.826  ORF Transcript_684/g.826 Transcript_684/m.826 type:complete len:278 (-) Transcript_684:54-887(-)
MAFVWNRKVFVLGGMTYKGWKQFPLNSSWMYNPIKNTWTKDPLPPMLTKRFGAAVYATTTKVYVFGGNSQSDSKLVNLKTSEVYDSKTNTWTELPTMKYPKPYASVVQRGDKLIVFGCATKESPEAGEEYHMTAEQFDLNTNTWTIFKQHPPLSQLMTPIIQAGQTLWSFGGYVVNAHDWDSGCPTSNYSSNECWYCPPGEDTKWTKMTNDLKTARRGPCGAEYKGNLYVFGGAGGYELGGWKQLTSIEILREGANEWEYLPCRFKEKRENFAFVMY